MDEMDAPDSFDAFVAFELMRIRNRIPKESATAARRRRVCLAAGYFAGAAG